MALCEREGGGGYNIITVMVALTLGCPDVILIFFELLMSTLSCSCISSTSLEDSVTLSPTRLSAATYRIYSTECQ